MHTLMSPSLANKICRETRVDRKEQGFSGRGPRGGKVWRGVSPPHWGGIWGAISMYFFEFLSKNAGFMHFDCEKQSRSNRHGGLKI